MVRKRYTEEQIIAVLNEAAAGAKTADLCRKHGMSDATFYCRLSATLERAEKPARLEVGANSPDEVKYFKEESKDIPARNR